MDAKTVVVFRAYKDSEFWVAGSKSPVIIALFPYMPRTNSPNTCLCYEQHGQHLNCDPLSIISRTKLATPEQYAALKHELESPPFEYNFVVKKRIPADAYLQRRAALNEMNGKANRG